MKLFVVPTHRDCKKAVQSILLEMKSIASNTELMLLVLDNGTEENYLANARFLSEIDAIFKILHLGRTDMQNIVVAISEKMTFNQDLLFDLLYPQSIDYGKIFNFIYIIATILGATSIHRRDSDCDVDDLDTQHYPVYFENKYIGEKVNKIISEVEVQSDTKYDPDEVVAIVGSGYYGDLDLDFSEILETNPNALKTLMKIVQIEDDILEKEYEKKYGNHEEKKEHEQPILSTVFIPSNAIECGNLSMNEIYKYIPNFIGEYGVGYDYHTHFMSSIFEVPIVYHDNKIRHLHDKKRYNDLKFSNYWEGIIKMVEFDNFHYKFIEANYTLTLTTKDKRMDWLQANCESRLPDLWEHLLNNYNYQERIGRIEEIITNILLPTKTPIYIKVAKELAENQEKIIAEIDCNYRKSILLQRNWRKIIEICEGLELELLEMKNKECKTPIINC